MPNLVFVLSIDTYGEELSLSVMPPRQHDKIELCKAKYFVKDDLADIQKTLIYKSSDAQKINIKKIEDNLFLQCQAISINQAKQFSIILSLLKNTGFFNEQDCTASEEKWKKVVLQFEPSSLKTNSMWREKKKKTVRKTMSLPKLTGEERPLKGTPEQTPEDIHLPMLDLKKSS